MQRIFINLLIFNQVYTRTTDALFRNIIVLGEIVQGLRAVIPHLIMPMAFEQSDNAGRLKRLGVGDCIEMSNYNKTTVSKKFETLLNSENTQEHCRKTKCKFDNYHGVSDTCDEIMSVVKEEN